MYYSRNFPRKTWFTNFDAVGTLAIATPSTSARIVIDGLFIGNNGVASTIIITKGYVTKAPLAMFTLAASASISVPIFPIEVKEFDRSLYADVASGGTNSWNIFLTGFELQQ